MRTEKASRESRARFPKIDSVEVSRWWPKQGPLWIVGHPHEIIDVPKFIDEQVEHLRRALAGDRSEPFTVPGILDRLQKVGVWLEVEQRKRRKQKRGRR